MSVISFGSDGDSRFERFMCRCVKCRRWVTIGPAEASAPRRGTNPNCPDPDCDGELEPVDMQEHIASLPIAKPEPEK